MTPEGKVKKAVNDILAKHGAYPYMPVQGKYTKRSIDYIVCAYGRYLGIETKATGEEPTPEQDNTMRDMRAAGGATLVIDGSNIYMLNEWLLWASMRAKGRGPYEYDPPELPITNLTGN
jgi:hypothetical protein